MKKRLAALAFSLALFALLLPAPARAAERRALGVGTAPQVLGASSHVLLPTAAYVNGAFGAVFRTRISITNVTGNSYTIRAGFSGRAGEVASQSFTIFAHETRTFDQFIQTVFGSSGAGAIDLDAGDAANRFLVNAQVYVDTPNGRYTTAVEPADETGTITPDHPGWVVGVSVDNFDRTNVGCASDSAQPQHVIVQVLDPSGNMIGGTGIDLAPYGWDQVSVNVPVSGGALYLTTDQRAVCYGVVVDNVSNDGTFRLAVAD